jgi:hypothetical protein
VLYFSTQLAASFGQCKMAGQLLWHGAPIVWIACLESHGVHASMLSVWIVFLAVGGGSVLYRLDVVHTEGVLVYHVANLGRNGEERRLIWLDAKE